MVIQRTTVGSRRVELQNSPIILATSAVAGLSTGDLQKVTNPALDFTILVWDGNDLLRITPAAAYNGAFNQYKARVMIELNIDIPDTQIFGVTNGA